jgi:ATP/maltotriose-dependent transcriptional regulator MalT
MGALATFEGELSRARALYEQAIEILGHENKWLVANAVVGLAGLALSEGDTAAARQLGEQSLAIYRRVGDDRLTTESLYLLAAIHIAERQLEAAGARLREGLTISQVLQAPIGLITGLVGFGSLATAQQRPVTALRLLGAALAHGGAGEFGFLMQRLAVDRRVKAAYSMLDAHLADAAFAAGQTLTLEQAVEEVLTASVGAPGSPPTKTAADGPLSRLSGRETEVLRLLITGKSNREIAESLVIAASTAERHVANILSKLRVGSRTAAADLAHRAGFI